MKDNCKISKFLKTIIALSIALACIMPTSANLFSAYIEKGGYEKSLENNEDGAVIVVVDIYVDDDNTNGPWDGTIEHPYQYIQDGIDNADTGYVVYVFNGNYNENIVVFKSISLIGEDKDNTIIDGGGDGNVVKITVDGVCLRDFTIKNSGVNPNNAGVSVHSQNNVLYSNNIINNNYGIRLVEQSNVIYHNNFIDNIQNAYDDSNNDIYQNYWDDYYGVDENEDGIGESPYSIPGDCNKDESPLIHIYGSITNVDTKEIFLTIQSAIADSDTTFGDTILVKNDIYYEHVCIYKSINLIGENKDDTIIDGRGLCNVVKIYANSVFITGFTIRNSGGDTHNAGILVQADDNTITGNIIEGNYHGIYLKSFSDRNEISANSIRNNNWNGIYLKYSGDSNIIFENTIENNVYGGIGISGSSYNIIFHNNFTSNLHNAYDDSNNIWDDGYPSGGNYWDDYSGIDIDMDGIGDTPYNIPDGINKDRYPLMNPYGSGDIIPPYVEITSPKNGLYIRNHQLFPLLFRQKTIILGKINVTVDAYDAQSGISTVEFYLTGDPNPQWIDDTEPYYWIWKRGSLIRHRHILYVVAHDNAGNYNVDMIKVRKYF